MIAFYHKWSVFHLVKWILLQGLLRGWLFTKGYAGLLATIETGADGVTVKPYVKLYSKTEVRRLLKDYEIEDISIHQLKLDHFFPSYMAKGLSRVLPSLRNFPKLESHLGWYVACKARRSDDLP